MKLLITQNKKMKTTLDSYLLFISMMALVIFGCSKNEENPSDFNQVVATEKWEAVMDNDSLNHGTHTFYKKTDGSITTSGTWYHNHQGTEVVCQFNNGPVTINDTVVVFTAQGTATNPAAPVGYQTSPFTFSTTGTAKNEHAYGTYSIKFSTMGWPSEITGVFASVRVSGSGITK